MLKGAERPYVQAQWSGAGWVGDMGLAVDRRE